MILFLVTQEREAITTHVLVTATGREDAKRQSREHLGGDPDKYIVSPLTSPGDRVKVVIATAIL